MSVTEDTREITPEILAHYINFQTEHTQITVSGTHTALEQSDANARLGKDTNAILQMILTLRHDIEQLKTEVAQLKQGQWNANNPPSTTPSYLSYHRDTPVITHEIIDNAEEIVEEETQSSTPTAPLRTKKRWLERDLISGAPQIQWPSQASSRSDWYLRTYTLSQN